MKTKFARKLVSALILIGCVGTAASAVPVIIEGQLTCAASYTVTGNDVIIRNVTFSSTCTSRSLTVTVTNGTITIDQGGIAGFGPDGTNAQPGDVCVVGDQVSAGAAKAGAAVSLRSLAGTGTRPAGVYVYSPIDVRGGHGGEGVTGNSETEFPGTCGTCGPDNGLPGTAGAAGGSVSIVSDGPIQVSATINTSGGAGGSGGSGGFGNRQGPGLSAAGSNGGAGGPILINFKRTGLTQTVSIGNSLITQGGSGGNGGNGANSLIGISSASNAGNGGSGGVVTIVGGSLSVGGSINSSGGAGGFGGLGASSPIPGWLCEVCPVDFSWIRTCTGVISATNGGNGGNGGAAAAITYTGFIDASFGSLSTSVAEGGFGGAGNMGGNGASGYTDCPDCDDPQVPDHTNQCPGVAANGHPGNGGNGGNGASIKVTAPTVPAVTGAYFNSAGGCGGPGAHGNTAQCVSKITDYPPGMVICNEISATDGGNGGSGGSGGNVTFVLSSPLVGSPSSFTFGGGGGRGGDGGDAFTCPNWQAAPGAGGTGGLAGNGGYYSATGQPSIIPFAPRSDCGTQVQVFDDDLVVWRGEDGTVGLSGNQVGCPCAGN